MYIDIDNDNRSYIFWIGRTPFDDNGITFSIRWFRRCPVGWCGYEPYHDVCPLCHDEAVIPWYRGWIFELRRWWAYGPGYRIWEWREKRREREQ